MKLNRIVIGGGALALVAAAYGLYRVGVTQGMARMAAPGTGLEQSAQLGTQAPAQTGDIDPATGRRVLYWHDPMVPGPRFDRPGRSPFMNMALVPVYEGGDEGTVAVGPRMQQSLGVRTAEVTRVTLTPRIQVVGNVEFNERDQVVVQARALGYVERLHVRATLDPVTRGEPLVELYVPEWVAAQEELLAVLQMRAAGVDGLLDGARRRMRQVGMSEEQIRRVEASGELESTVTMTAPIDGVVVELGARQGVTAKPGDTLFRINGIDPVWVKAAVPESQAALLELGAAVEAHLPARPNTRFEGTVQAILPKVDPATRTVEARFEVANTARLLAPGMILNIAVAAGAVDGLTVPSEAVIRTGTRNVVILAEPSGTFRPVNVELGLELDERTEITAGLEEGQRVVASGQFLIDSEASLRASSLRMEAPPDVPASAPEEHVGTGTIASLGDGAVTLSHGPIPSLGWGSMTMEFALPPNAEPDLARGDAVEFAFVMGDDGRPFLTRIARME